MKSLIQNLTAIVLSIIFISSFARAMDTDSATLRKDLPKLLGSTNEGTEFFMTFHPCWESASKTDGCKIYISSAVATKVTIEIPAKGIYIVKTTIPNDIIEINLTPDKAQCYSKDNNQPPQPQRIYQGYGIIVTSMDPIICYGVTRFEYTSDGYLAIPKSALGKKYVVSSYNDPCKESDKLYLTSYTSIVGVYNNTRVNVKLGGRASNFTPGARPLTTGATDENTINRGDVWLIGTMGDYNDLTGTVIEANKQVSVISGSFCAYVPINIGACDFLIEQDLPMESWGSKYHVSPIIKRKKGSIIRIFASEPNTTIYRDGNEWATVQTVGGADGKGYIERRSVTAEESLKPVTISALNPIAVTQYNTGMSDDDIESDPFQMALIPIDQYLNRFIWCTPGVNDGSSFKNNYVNLCYKSTENGKIPDDIEFGKITNGQMVWKKLSEVVNNPGLAFADKSISDSRYYRCVTLTLDDPAGVYSLRGTEPMMAYGYGFDWADSYGFPVTGCFNDNTKHDIWAPRPTFSIDCRGQAVGNVTEQPESDEALRSNLSALRLINSDSYNFSNVIYDETIFLPGETFSIDWSINVLDPEFDAKAFIAFTDRAGNDTTITIEYSRTRLTASNRIENWGSKAYNDPLETKELSIINESHKPVVVDSIILLSKDSDKQWEYNGFTLDPSIYKENGGVLPGYTIHPGESLKYKVSFNPQSLDKEIAEGKTAYADSVRVKANWQPDAGFYCCEKTLGVVKATISAVSVEDLSGMTGIFEISPNPATKKDVSVTYAVKNEGVVLMSLYNANGILISELVNSYQPLGSHILTIPIDELAQGTYFVEFKAGDLVQHRSFVVVK
ncbi:MAG: T9SS type A sorting domain-containing protein [bacterium]